MTSKALPTDGRVSPDAAVVLGSLGSVMTALRRTPLSVEGKLAATLNGVHPKPRHIAALLAVAGNQQMSVSDLSARLQVSLATASQLVSDLADLGLVERVEDPSDRRRTLIAISGSHRPLIAEVLEARLRPIDEALARLTTHEREGLCKGLQRLATELEHRDLEVVS